MIARASVLAIAACGHSSPRGADDEVGTVITARTEGGEVQRLRIDSWSVDPDDRDLRLYGLSIFHDGAWTPYCSPDLEGHAMAIPVNGSWNEAGEAMVGASELVTFACTSGAIAKCIRFGYKPWKVPLAPYHAACTRMVRADYCGDGRTHTVDGTRIDIWDRLGIQQRDERGDRPEVFEAAWSPAGAAYLNVPRWSDDVDDVIRECPARFEGRSSRARPLRASEVADLLPDALVFNARFLRAADRR